MGVSEVVAHHPAPTWGSQLIQTEPWVSLTLSVLPLGPQPQSLKRPPEVQHFRMSDDVHSLGER